jgi:hypothetical protein
LVRQDEGEFKMTAADVANAGLDEKAVIDYATRTLFEGDTVKVNIPHRIYQVYGRPLTLEGADGSHAMVATFDLMGRLYPIEAKVPPGGNEFGLACGKHWCSSAASRTARRRKSVPFAKPVAAWQIPLLAQGWTIDAVKHRDECRLARRF